MLTPVSIQTKHTHPGIDTNQSATETSTNSAGVGLQWGKILNRLKLTAQRHRRTRNSRFRMVEWRIGESAIGNSGKGDLRIGVRIGELGIVDSEMGELGDRNRRVRKSPIGNFSN